MDVPQAALLHELVARQAADTPEAVAVADGPRTLGYAELDGRANQLANHLRGLGTGPESLVGVCLPRGFDLVVALLAVWRAGAAYVPLDPGHPADRRAWILADTGAGILLTHQGLRDRAAESVPRTVCLDAEWPAVAGCPDTDPRVAVEPDGAAYAIYTSGTTGRPKGVVITHEGIRNRVLWTVRRHGLSAADRVIQKTSVSFDAAGWEFFGPLVSGGTVVLAPAGAERDPAALVREISDQEVTVLQGVPSVLRLLADEPGWGKCAALRLVFSAGEPLHHELCQRLMAGLQLEVWNTYGPTECSIDVAAWPVDPQQLTGPAPIGRPIDNARLLVLDPEGAPVPVGVVGELYIGGVGVGRGYVNLPDLTADRFVPDEYGEPGSRLYRTGDKVRWRPGGTLEYVGRVDAQLKVNGVRVEPGEVEAALAEHPDVRGAAVVGFADRDGQPRLAAYVVGAAELEPARLRGFLLDRLPEAIVPAVIQPLEAFPLTASGKVDRGALPPVDTTTRRAYVAPRNRAERIVADAWRELLGVDQPGVHDDFFQLGGSSLELARLVGRLGVEAGGKVALRGLFTTSTLEGQAELVAAAIGQPEQADRTLEPVPEPVPVPVPRDGTLPLSFGQHRLWFLDRMHPGSPEWVSPLFMRLPAELNPDTVRWALVALEARHEALRTRYVTEDGQPRQVPRAGGDVELRAVTSDGTDLVQLFSEQFARGFDLERGQLWRAMLVSIPGEDHILLVTTHHIASDGWSTVVLERELRELCAAFAEGRAPLLPDLPVQYADFAVWQHAQLTDAVVARELDYWRKELADLPQLELPADWPRPPERDPRGAGVRVELPAGLAQAVTELGQRCGATPFMTLLTGFAAVLARYTGQWDLPIGVPVAGRARPEVKDVAGFFLNSLVLRCRLEPRLSFLDAVRRLRGVATSAFAHQELPFERLVDELVPERDLSRTPLYQVAFDLQEAGATSVSADPTAMEAFQEAWRVAKTDLTLFMWRQPDGSLAGAFEYATSIFDRDTVQRLADHFVRLLSAMVAEPGAQLNTVDFLTDGERNRLTVGWNATAAPRPALSVLDLFEARAACCPDAIAVCADGAVTSYAELDARANRVARQLRAAGAGPGAVVAVLLERGTDLIATLLGVWKAGAAYLPIDHSYPADRVAYMLDTAGARLAVTNSRYADRFTVPALLLDAHALMVATESPEPMERATHPDELAYVIFTSGSTGRPKGVQVTHRGLANHVLWAAQTLAARGTGGAPLFSSVAFDLVVPNLWAPLVTGQRVFVVDDRLDLARLGAVLAAAAPFSFIKLTPGHLELLGHQLGDAAAKLAQAVVVAGEALPGGLANRWLGLLGPGNLINEYGPTEASVGTSIFPVEAEQRAEVVPIGRPLPNMTMYVLDDQMRPCPLGVVGELYAGGTGVARGYAGRPDLTADRFPPDPFGPAGSRLYRTGDLVRRLPDGNVAFLGRIDDQVKIRGYRIELGEIQAVIEAHPRVRSAVVVIHQDRLVAYHVGDAADLPDHCAGTLPEYMIPSLFVPVDSIPLTANGKVDRAALPDPDRSAAGEGELVAPRDVVEERIAGIWSELLGVPVGVTHNFFRLGGHSILAVRLVSRLQEEFDLELPIRLIFERPTVAGLAEAVTDRIQAEVAAIPDGELADASLSKELQA